MKTTLKTLVAAGALLAAGGSAANALPLTFELEDATFSDGGTMSGEFTLDVYGFLTQPTKITTTAGTNLGGFTYQPPETSANGLSVVDFFSSTYNRDLHIVFDNPLIDGGYDAIDPNLSYECDGFTCPSDDTRYFTGGAAVAASEPAGLALLSVGFFGFAWFGWRRRVNAAAV